MGVAAYNRGSKHIRDEISRESAKRQPAADLAATYENTAHHNEWLLAELEATRAELVEARQALGLEMAAHERTIKRAEDAAQIAYQSNTSLRRSYSEVSEKLFSARPLTKYEGMLLSCEDGGFVLVHPGAGGLASLASLEEARQWATRHDGFIPRNTSHHAFHGSYYRVGFNLWPERCC